MEPSENNKIMYYLLQSLSFILTLILLILAIIIVVHVIHCETYYHVVYFIAVGAVYMFIKYGYANFSYKNKYLYLIVIIVGIILLFLSMISLP